MDHNAPPTEERLIFARNFRAARQNARLSQRTITERTGFSQSCISEVENGRTPTDIDRMSKLAAVVGVPLWKLLKPN